MKLTLIVGPMFAGKTTFIIEKFSVDDTIAFKPLLDNRYSKSEIVSHNNVSIPCIVVESLTKFFDKKFLSKFKNIIIDEGQFFSDIYEFISKCENLNINIFVAALNSDFNRKPFDNINNLYARADSIIYKQGKCNNCKNKSSFSWRKKANYSSQIEIGGTDKYIPVCGNCYQTLYSQTVEEHLNL